MLMGTAEVLAQYRENLKRTVKIIFQPAEEGPPEGEGGGVRSNIIPEEVEMLGTMRALHPDDTIYNKQYSWSLQNRRSFD